MAKRKSLILAQSISRSKRRKKWFALSIVVIICISGISYLAIKSSPSNRNDKVAVKGSMPAYDEQEIISFDENFTSLSFNVKAVEQQDSVGYGPSYLLNGLSDNGYWYQVGISYHWSMHVANQSYYWNGWTYACEVFDYAGKSIFQVAGGKNIILMNIRNQDTVNLNLYFKSNGSVVMKVVDLNNSVSELRTFSAFGGDSFVGTRNTSSNIGFFTGLMTEWYHTTPYYGNESNVTYESSIDRVQFVNFGIEEFETEEGNYRQYLFSGTTPYPVNLFEHLSKGVWFNYKNATIEWQPNYFVTG